MRSQTGNDGAEDEGRKRGNEGNAMSGVIKQLALEITSVTAQFQSVILSGESQTGFD